VAETIRLGPVGRIDQDMAVDITVDGGAVTEARMEATMARGFETILRGRDPRDAIVVAQRICGICPAPHAVASAQALDDLTDARVPPVARIVRNLILGATHVSSHILSFFLATLPDYIDPSAVSRYRGKDKRIAVVASKVGQLLDAGDGAPFLPRYAGDEATLKDPDVVGALLADYFDALHIKRKAETMAAALAGRHPHICSVVAGGVTIPISVEQVTQFRFALQDVADWVSRTMFPDAKAIASGPMALFKSGRFGGGQASFLSFGAFDQNISGDYKDRFLPSGAIVAADLRDLSKITVQQIDPAKVTESLTYARYGNAYDGRNPAEVVTEFDPGKRDAYTFVKGARYDGKPMEVGPLARMLVKRDAAFLRELASTGAAPQSVPARVLARAYEAKIVARAMLGWLDDLIEAMAQSGDICDEKEFPDKGRAVGILDAPRGALGHWVSLDADVIDIYQVVGPSTWNASPRDGSMQRGPIEEALIGTPVPDVANPLNVVRVIRSFDPCLTCAVHIIDGRPGRLTRVG